MCGPRCDFGGLRQVLVMGLTWWWSGRSLLLRREVVRECGMLERGGSGRETLGTGSRGCQCL